MEDAPSTTRLYHRRADPPRRRSTTSPSSSTGSSSTPTPSPCTADELVGRAADRRRPRSAQRLVEAADGSVRIIATALEQSQRRPVGRPGRPGLADGAGGQLGGAPAAHRQGERRRRPAGPGAGHRPPPARPPGRRRVRRSGGARRHPAAPPGHRWARPRDGGVVPHGAGRRRGRRASWPPSCSSGAASIEAIGLLLDAGDHEQATPAGHGAQRVDHRHGRAAPAALAAGPARTGHRARAGAAAAAGVGDVGHRARRRRHRRHRPGRRAGRRRRHPPLRRRVAVEAARARLAEGRHDEAVRAAEQALVDLGDGEEQTFARAHEVLAESAATSDARADLQRAAECYRIAVVGVGGLRRVRPRPGLPARPRGSACSSRSAATTRRSPSSASCSARPTCPTPSAR